MTSEPNGRLFKSLFAKLGVHAGIYKSKGIDTVTIPVGEAARLQVFNPEIETHRNLLLGKLAGARTFPARWPAWLERKVLCLLADGYDLRTTRNKLLLEGNTYVTLKTLKFELARLKK